MDVLISSALTGVEAFQPTQQQGRRGKGGNGGEKETMKHRSAQNL